jgi:hypothetical protein
MVGNVKGCSLFPNENSTIAMILLTFLFKNFIPIHYTLSFLLNYSKHLASLLKEIAIRFPLDNLILAKYLCDQTRCLPNCFQVHRPLHYH